MNQQRSFYRKISYGAAIAVLLVILSLLSLPNTSDRDQGGKLAQLRTEYGLSQGTLGEVDPAGETIKLATLGMRGIAVQRLWAYATEMKKTENWSEFSATLELLAKLQPNFITFWKYQSWNVSYNVSVEFDDYRDRYYYVRRGIEFLKQGQEYNRNHPQLLWEMGWFIGQKIGRSDEKVQYRRLFKADDDYHPEDRPPGQRDNWLVSKGWYEESVRAAEEKGIGRKSPVIFYGSPAKSQMNYSDAIGTEGLFDRSLAGWKRSAEMWRDFGNREVQHSKGVRMRLNDLEFLTEESSRMQTELKELAPDLFAEMYAEARERLSEEQLAAIDLPADERTYEQWELAILAMRRLRFDVKELADRIAKQNPESRRKAGSLASSIQEVTTKASYIDNYRNVCNFNYWKTRADFEQTRNAIEAHELLYRARRAWLDESDAVLAKELYEKGLAKWRAVFDEFPQLWNVDGTTGDDVMIEIVRYSRVLEQQDEKIPDDFPLWRIIENFDVDRKLEDQLQQYQQRQRAKAAPNQ